jgi:hypothetical protein
MKQPQGHFYACRYLHERSGSSSSTGRVGFGAFDLTTPNPIRRSRSKAEKRLRSDGRERWRGVTDQERGGVIAGSR